MRLYKSILLLVGILTAVSSAQGEPPSAFPFETARVIRREVTREHVFDGVIQAVQEGTVSAETSGRIVEVNFDVDDYVPKGGVLLRFNDTRQQAALSQAEANLKEAEARYREAESNFRRIQGLVARDVVSKQDMDKARADLDAAKARLESAEAGVTQAREGLEHTVVKAPYSGVVVKRHIEVGEAASVGQPLMTGFSLERLRAETVVPQRLVDAVREHARARIIVPFRPGESIPGRSLTVTPYADRYTHTFRVRVELPEGEHGIYPGTFVKVAFVTGREPRLLIPARAVAYRSEVRAVYVIAPDGRITFRQVRLGRTHGEELEVLAGLDEGERIALEPVRAAVFLKEKREGR